MSATNNASSHDKPSRTSPRGIILVVEDDSGIRETLKLVLELEGFDVYTAIHGQDAIAILTQIQRPCLIFLDLMMPVMDGYEFATYLEKDKALSTIPIVVVTAFAEKAKKISSAKAVIKKPLDIATLVSVTKKWCGSPNAA